MPSDFGDAFLVPFPTTRWSIVDGGDARLGDLYRQYQPVMVSYYMRVRRLSHDEAEETVAAFVADVLLGRRLAESAERERGRFRSLLCTALDRFLVSRIREKTAAKRKPAGASIVPMSAAVEPAERSSADVFDREWANTLLSTTLERMRTYCDSSDQQMAWYVFDRRFVAPLLSGEDPPSFATIVAETGIETPSQASNLHITARRMFHRMLRSAVFEYVGDESLIDAEIAELFCVLSKLAQD